MNTQTSKQAVPAKRRHTAFSQEIELRGHIIDSLTLPKVLNEILLLGGDFRNPECRSLPTT